MLKHLLLLLLLWTGVMAADFSDMSTQELLAIVGYETPENEKALKKELDIRYDAMTPKEKKEYERLYPKSSKQ